MSEIHGRPLLGIALLVGSGVCFTLLDAAAKHVIAVVPVMMALSARYLLQSVLSSALLRLAGQHRVPPARRWALQLLRGVLLLASSVMAVLAIERMPLAEFTAIVLLTPLVVSLVAVLVMKESLDSAGWGLLALSFAGTLLIVRPGGAVEGVAAAYTLCCVVLSVSYHLLTGVLGRSEHPTTTHLISTWTATALLLLMLPWNWAPVGSMALWGWMGFMGLAGAFGHLMVAHAYRHAPASTLAPFQYVCLVWATLLGWAVFEHLPDRITFAGMALIAACGVVNTRRHMLRGRRPRRSPHGI